MKSYAIEANPETSGQREIPGSITCDFCKSEINPAFNISSNNSGSIAFANFDTWEDADKKPVKICKACSAKAWKELIQSIPLKGKICLYLTNTNEEKYVSNWNGTLKIPVRYIHKGYHNIAGSRYDFWFNIGNSNFYGVNYGENTQIAHCRRIK